MGQQEIIECLKEANRPLTALEIAEKLGQGMNVVCERLNRMLKGGDIYYIELDRFTARLLFNNNVKRRMKLYCLEKPENVFVKMEFS